MTDGLFWLWLGLTGIFLVPLYGCMRLLDRGVGRSIEVLANPPMMAVPPGSAPSLTPGSITFGSSGQAVASSAAALKQQAIVQQGLYGYPGASSVGSPVPGFQPSPYANDPLYKLAEIIAKVITVTEYEMEAGARDLSQRVYGTMGHLALPASDCDKQALLRLAWKCRAILPPELATYAALGGGVDNDERAEPAPDAD